MLCVFDKKSIACSIGGLGENVKGGKGCIRFALGYTLYTTLHVVGSGKKCKRTAKDASIWCAALYIIHYTRLYYTILHYTTLYYIKLHYTIL